MEVLEPKAKLKKAPAYRFFVFFQMLLGYILLYAGIQLIATLGPELMADLQIKETQLGVFSALNNPTFAVASLIAGMLVAKFRGKKVMVAGLVLMAVAGALYMMHIKNFVVLCIIRLIQGFATGLVDVVVLGMCNVWFPKRERGISQGVLSCFYGASTSVVTAYCAIMNARNMGWSQTAGYMLVFGSLALAVIILIFYKDIEKAHGVHVIDDAIEGMSSDDDAVAAIENDTRPNTLQECLKSPVFWLSGCGLFFYCGSCFGTGFCLPLFLSGVGFDDAAKTAVMTYGSLGTILFCLAGGVLSDKVFTKRTPIYMMAFGLAAVFTVVMAILGHTSTTVMIVLYFVMIGFCNFAAGPAWALPSEIVGPNMAQTNTGISLLFSNLGGTVMLIIYGAVAESFGGVAVMYALAACMAATFVFALLLNRIAKV